MKILLGCECSNTTAKEFRKLGHKVLSCDIQDNDEDNTNHYKGDVMDVLYDGWDLMIAHPPCTFLSRAGARWLYQNGSINQERLKNGMLAKEFFIKLLNAQIKYICIENPLPLKIYELPKESQVVQPYEYGHEYSKRTHLWLKNLPNLIPTDIKTDYTPYMPSNTGGAKRGQKATIKNMTKKLSSKSFSGISKAMAIQWDKFINQNR